MIRRRFESSIARRLLTLGWQIRQRCRQARRAFSYATGCPSPDDAQRIIFDCQFVAGLYPLMTLTPDDVFDMAIDVYGDEARTLAPYLADACAYVAHKWAPPGDDYWHAREWALNIALRAAAQNGIQISSLFANEFEETTNAFSQGEQVTP